MAERKTPKPGRALATITLIIVALYGALFAGDTRIPRLGLDLQGGTQVILQPVGLNGKAPAEQSLNQAVQIITNRVNGLGVAEAEVTTQGRGNIVVAVPGKGRDEVLAAVGRTAQLRFREVLAAIPATPAPQPTPSGSAPASPGATPTRPAAPSPTVSPSTVVSPPTVKVPPSAAAPSPSTTSNGRVLSRALLAPAAASPE
ncbi:MAG: protein translocase subunit SecD, partial [Actinomycetota bacterium]|nr:protein translocase subunit SecD [Actinomycetota bacterium]